MQNLFALMADGSDHSLASILPSHEFFLSPEAMEVTGKLNSGEARRKANAARAEARSQLPPVVAVPQTRTERGSVAKSKNDGVNFQIEITVTKGEHAHVFKFECGDKHVTAAGKGLVRMRGNFERLRKDQVSALGALVTDFVGDMGLILLRERR
jgi:hypothetical protein